jgi:nicotinate phosphoribosyltransferase
MVKQTLIKLIENFKEYTDKYFQRTKKILRAEGINPNVRYQVFARKGGVVKGVDEAVQFVKDTAGKKARVYALRDGQTYAPCEPLMKIEGQVQDLVELETVYLGLISNGLTGPINMDEVREKAAAIVKAANRKPVFYMGARHFNPLLDEQIARICYEQGFAGASTDIGAKAWNGEGFGTTPHALIIAYAAYMDQNKINGNPTVEAAKSFDKNIEKDVKRIMLIDTFNREITDTIETARAVPALRGVRIDTCGENYAQGTVPMVDGDGLALFDEGRNYHFKEYFQGKGVTIAAVWALREALVKNNFGKLEQTVSSGFNAEKTAAFVEADAVFREKFGYDLFTNIGTGSIASPVMATADIVAYKDNRGEWKEMHKVGRPEIQTYRLEEVK